jgi:hypothetical protein
VELQKTLFIVANLYVIKEAGRTMAKAVHGEKFDFSFFTDVLSSKALSYRESGKDYMDKIKKGEF